MIHRRIATIKNELERKYGVNIIAKNKDDGIGRFIKLKPDKFVIQFRDFEEKFHELGHVAVYLQTRKEIFAGIKEYEIPKEYFPRFVDIYLYTLDWFVFLWEIENENREKWEESRKAIEIIAESDEIFMKDFGKSILNVLDGKSPVGGFVLKPKKILGILKYYISKDRYSFEYKDGIVYIKKGGKNV